jgi:hypothetical protein
VGATVFVVFVSHENLENGCINLNYLVWQLILLHIMRFSLKEVDGGQLNSKARYLKILKKIASVTERIPSKLMFSLKSYETTLLN